MADEKLQYTLELATRATGDGARSTAADMARVAAETERARAASAGLLTAAERERAEVERLIRSSNALAAAKREAGRESERLANFMRRTADDTRVSFGEFYDLDAQFQRTNRSSETFTNGVTKMKGPVRNSGQALLLFSQGFEDAQYGMRGVLNNIPSLILSLGGTAGLAGGISIAAVALSELIPLLTDTANKAEFTAEKIQEIADAAGDDERANLDAISQAIESAAEQAAALRQTWSETEKAEADYAATAITNAEKIEAAQRNIAAALGLQVDHFRELENIAALEAQKREQAARAAIAAEQSKLETAREAVTVAGDNLAARENEMLNAEFRRRSLQGELELLRQQKEALEAIVAGRRDLNAALPPGLEDFQTFISEQAARPGSFAGFQGVVRGEAEKRLADPIFQGSLAAAEKRIAALEDKIETLATDGGIISRAEIALTAAQTKLEDIEAAVGTNIQSIQDTLAADNLIARSQELVKSGEVLATELQGMLGGLETRNAQGQAAKDAIGQAIADGRVTDNENAALAANLRTLIGQLQSGQATLDGGVQRLINLQTEALQMWRRSDDRITALESQMRANNQVRR